MQWNLAYVKPITHDKQHQRLVTFIYRRFRTNTLT